MTRPTLPAPCFQFVVLYRTFWRANRYLTHTPLGTLECRECNFCKSGKTNLCGKIRATQGRGEMHDGTERVKARGKESFHFIGTSTFSRYTDGADLSVLAIGDTARTDRTGVSG